MKRLFAIMLAVLLTMSLATACTKSDVNDTVQPTSEDLMQQITPNLLTGERVSLSQNSKTIADFAVRLFQKSVEKEENTLISPLSVMVALAMTANGADNNTLQEMETVLGMPVSELNSWIHGYMENLPVGDKYNISLANSIWIKDIASFSVKKDFLQTNADYYNAGIYKAPFDETTYKEINGWVEENTDGMIKNILDKIPEDVVMYLINALTFDAEWQRIYEENQIRDGIFTTEDGIKQDVEMMYSEEERYLEDEKAVGFIKYYSGRKYAFAALLPKEGGSVAEYVASLDGAHLQTLLDNDEYTVVNVALPKFETEYSVEMRKILIDMGMADAFSASAADFSKIWETDEENLYISRVLHKTYINVDGMGTKAGATTAVEMSTTAAAEPPKNPKQVYLDRPFVYMLIDCRTNLPFFMGTMMRVVD